MSLLVWYCVEFYDMAHIDIVVFKFKYTIIRVKYMHEWM